MNQPRAPQPDAPRRVLIAVPDLFFVTRIRAVADRLAVAIEECPLESLAERCATGAPDLVILDLHAPGDVLAPVRALKADARGARIPIVGFYSHVEGETRRRAVEAGVDHVLPRSAFTARLPDLLAGSR
jgi:CheY-like chemotaxis protein